MRAAIVASVFAATVAVIAGQTCDPQVRCSPVCRMRSRAAGNRAWNAPKTRWLGLNPSARHAFYG